MTTSDARKLALLVATGVAYKDPCHRCGGSGIYSQYHGTCYGCGGNGRRAGWRPLWASGRITHTTLDKVEARYPGIADVLGQGRTFVELARIWNERAPHILNPRPFTKAQWVRHEGERVTMRLREQREWAAQKRERAEREADKKALFAKRDAEIGYADIPEHGERVALTAEILTTREDASFNRYVTKALLKAALSDGTVLKLWGTLPGALEGCDRGDKIAFRAVLKRSDKDPKFGFWSRPTKAERIESEQVAL